MSGTRQGSATSTRPQASGTRTSATAAPRSRDAAAEQLERLHAYHVFGDFATRPALDLADRLTALAPVPGSKVFLTSGGSDSVDTAAKLARRYFHEIGQPGRTVILPRTWAYHGMHAYGTALAGIGANRDAPGELISDIAAVQWDSAPALRPRSTGRRRPDRGVLLRARRRRGRRPLAPEGYLAGRRELVRRRTPSSSPTR